MEELILRIRKSGITRKQLAKRLNRVPYGTLNKYLGEFDPMPKHVREDIERVLLEVENK